MLIRRLAAGVSAFALLCVASMRAQVGFDVPYTIPLALAGAPVAVADFHNDGFPDILVRSLGSPGTLVLLENDGSSLPFPATLLGPSTLADRPLVIDWNGDGFLDIVSSETTTFGNATLNFVLGSAVPGAFTTVVAPLLPGFSPHGLIAFDRDADGDLDLDVFAMNLAAAAPVVLPVTNNSNFVLAVGPQIALDPLADPTSSFGADLNADGQVDYISPNLTGISTAVVQPFGAPPVITNFLSQQLAVFRSGLTADFNGDGNPDIAFTDQTSGSQNGLSIFANTGLGGFLETPIVTARQGTGLTSGDIDADGDIDLVFGGVGPFAVIVYLNDGLGNFQASTTFGPFTTTNPLGGFAAAPLLADVDVDGDLDPLVGEIGGLVVRRSLRIGPNFDSITVTSGAGQAVVAGSNYASPLVVQVLDRTGAPRVGAFVEVSSSTGATAVGGPFVTGPTGEASITLTARSIPGVDTVNVATPRGHPDGIDVAFLATGARIITKIAGDAQAVALGQATPQPLTVRVTDALSGTPIGGIAVTFTVDGPGSFATPSPVMTDVQGLAQTAFTPTLTAGARTIAASAAQALPESFTLAVVPTAATLQIVSGNNQRGALGRDFSSPLRVRVVDSFGAPLVGEVVTFAVTYGTAMIATPAALCDSQGYAQSNVGGGLAAGATTVTASAGGAAATFQLFVRGLSASWSASTGFFFAHFQNDNPAPIVFAGDQPQPAPGFLPTPYGPIYTSILAPQPGFGALDGLGLFGPPDPSLFTAPGWSRLFVLPPAALSGITVVFQVYGLDLSIPFPDAAIVSNPVTITF